MGRPKLVMAIFVVAIIVSLKPILYNIFNPSIHRGLWYSVSIPEGWEKRVEGDEVVFLSPEEDIFTESAEAMFSIYAKKSEQALFLEDLFGEVLASTKKSNGRILDKGEVLLSGQLAKWLLYLYEEPPVIILTFYTVDDLNRITRIQYATKPERFKKFRKQFEEFKGSLKLKKAF